MMSQWAPFIIPKRVSSLTVAPISLDDGFRASESRKP